MMHDYHEGLPGFHPEQILHDGCGECERRGKDPNLALEHLDRGNFNRAWVRAAEWQKYSRAEHIAVAETELLRTLWMVQVRLEVFGIPVGTSPNMLGDAWRALIEPVNMMLDAENLRLREQAGDMAETIERLQMPDVPPGVDPDDMEWLEAGTRDPEQPYCEHGILPRDACALCNPDEVTS